jgi:hypothetical protein
MNAAVDRIRLAAQRIGWRKGAIFTAGMLVALLGVSWLAKGFVLKDENRPAGEEIVAALQAYKAANRRYPERFAQLQPKYLGRIPQPVPGTNFVYGTTYDGTSAWFGYQTLRDVFIEYDCQARKWESIDYDGSQALRARTREFVMGPK